MSKVKRIEQGHAGHFICANDCLFKRCTYLTNGYIVSTVGDFFPGSSDSKTNNKREEIGFERFFETMVFTAKAEQDECGCYRPSSWSEIDMEPANTSVEAQANHENLVEKWMKVKSVKK